VALDALWPIGFTMGVRALFVAVSKLELMALHGDILRMIAMSLSAHIATISLHETRFA
jgi:hypothetical protein